MANPQQGTGFTNLSNIINANQNNQLGNTIQQGVQKGISGLQSNLSQSQQQFQNDVNNANNQQQNQAQGNLVGNAISGIQNAQVPQAQTPSQQVTSSQTAPQSQPSQQQAAPASTPPSTTTTSANNAQAPASQPQTTAPAASTSAEASASTPGSFGFSNPTSGANATPTLGTGSPTAGQVSQIGQWAQGSYTGPNQLNNINALQAQAQNLQQQGQQVNAQGGLQALLQQYVGNPGYTQGQQTLDAMLLGQTGKQQLQNVVNSTQNLTNVPQTAETQAAALAQQTATGNQQFGQNIQQQIQAAENPILQNIQSNINAQNTTNTNNLNLAQQIYGALTAQAPNTPYEAAAANLNKTGGLMQEGPLLQNMTSATGSSLGQADSVLKLALQNGLMDQSTANNLAGYLATQNLNGQTPQGLLQAALTGYTPGMTNPQNSLQQGATMQQAAQLNALQQLAGQTPSYGTYGGMSAINPAFNLGSISGFNPNQSYNVPKPAAPVAAPQQIYNFYSPTGIPQGSGPLSQWNGMGSATPQ